LATPSIYDRLTPMRAVEMVGTANDVRHGGLHATGPEARTDEQERSPLGAAPVRPQVPDVRALSPATVLALQHGIGNHAVGTVLARVLNDGHDLTSSRFALNEVLEDIYDGNGDLRKGSRGENVRIVQQALIELGYELRIYGVDGKFEDETRTAVKVFQVDQGLPDSGRLDAATMGALDTAFAGHAPHRGRAQVPGAGPAPETERARGTAPPELMEGTRTLTPGEKADVEEALNPTPTVDPVTGLPPTFKPVLPTGEVYESRLKLELQRLLIEEFNAMAAGKAAQRSAPGGLHDWSDIENVAVQAKDQVDLVFGSWARRPALKAGVNLFDRWEQEEARMAVMTPDQLLEVAKWRVEKVFRSYEEIREINTQHGVRRERKDESDIIERVKEQLAVALQPMLLELHKAWPGAADPSTGSIFLQRFTSPTQAGNRRFMWETFQTLIHEYIHTLTHSRYSAWVDALPEERGHTLREGMTDFFTKIVWSNVNPATVQAAVEGPFHDPAAPPAPPSLSTYDEAANAERAVGITGSRNAYAAYFLGEIELMGGP
jgi:peptidoglycan hydrolase-like protein with peptidoglycan-binding domain